MLKFAGYAFWAAMAGALIPFMAVLNARLGKTLGEPTHAPVVLFLVALLTAIIVSMISTHQFPNLMLLTQAKSIDFAGGAIVAAYVISMTLLAPRFGVGNAILFVMTAQIVTSAAIDHFGLFGALHRPLDMVRIIGLIVMLCGLVLSQMGSRTSE
jgi:bacterial/archaeal transporter family-2 protein